MKTKDKPFPLTWEVVVPDTVFGKDGSGLHVLSSGRTYEEASSDLRLYLLDGIPASVQISQSLSNPF